MLFELFAQGEGTGVLSALVAELICLLDFAAFVGCGVPFDSADVALAVDFLRGIRLAFCSVSLDYICWFWGFEVEAPRSFECRCLRCGGD